MLFFYVRHGHPIYNPDQLTPLGRRQAEAVGKRLALFGMDRIYASTSPRARQTAEPLAELLNLPITELNFANEGYAWKEMTAANEEGRPTWAFYHRGLRRLFSTVEIRRLGDRWYEHPEVRAIRDFQPGITRVYDETDAFFASLGYQHERYSGKYRVIAPNNERIALFAHQGFGLAFLSCLLDIPYPQFCTHFDMTYTGVTVIDFAEEDGYAIPRVCTLSDMGHLYRDGLPLAYNNGFSV